MEFYIELLSGIFTRYFYAIFLSETFLFFQMPPLDYIVPRNFYKSICAVTAWQKGGENDARDLYGLGAIVLMVSANGNRHSKRLYKSLQAAQSVKRYNANRHI